MKVYTNNGMNPQQYPPQPGQGPGYPGQPGAYPPQGNYPPGQPGQWPQPGQAPQPGPYPPQQPVPGPMPGYGQPQPGYPPQQPMPGPTPATGYNPYAYPGEYDQKPGSKGPNKMVFISIVVVIALVAIIGGVIAMSGGSGNQDNNTQTGTDEQTTSTAGQDIVPRSDSTLDLSKKINNKDTLKAQTIKAKTKEQVNLSSGFSFMVTKIEDYTSPNAANKPATGKKFVVVTTVVGNRNQTGNISVSYLDFRLRDESNQLVAGNALTNELLNNPLSTPSEIKPGEQVTGKVIFEVDTDDTTWVFKHSETYQKTTDDTTFTVEGEIVVELPAAAGAAGSTVPAADATTPAPTTQTTN